MSRAVVTGAASGHFESPADMVRPARSPEEWLGSSGPRHATQIRSGPWGPHVQGNPHTAGPGCFLKTLLRAAVRGTF